VSEAKVIIELPNMDLCRARGYVLPPPTPKYGYTKNGTPRKTRPHALTHKEYQRERREKLLAEGLTARGTPRIRSYHRHNS
jgi:hypothetical protein